MYQTKQIFDKYNNEISLIQFKIYNPTSTLNLNAENKKTTFRIDLDDDFTSKNVQYHIAEKITPVDSTKTYSSKSNIKMVNHFVGHLQIEVKKHSTVFYEIEFTGFASTVKGCVYYPGLNEHNGEVFNSGFKTYALESQNFEAIGKLVNLGRIL